MKERHVSKESNGILTVLGVIILFFLLCVNAVLRPYPVELTMLGIEPEVNMDAVDTAIALNIIPLFFLALVWVFLIRKKRPLNYLIVAATVANLGALLYWFYLADMSMTKL